MVVVVLKISAIFKIEISTVLTGSCDILMHYRFKGSVILMLRGASVALMRGAGGFGYFVFKTVRLHMKRTLNLCIPFAKIYTRIEGKVYHVCTTRTY